MKAAVICRYRWVMLGLFAWSGCGPGVGEGPRPLPLPADSSVLDGASDAGVDASAKVDARGDATEIADVPVVNSYSCAYPKATASTVYHASQIGDSVRLITMGENTLLAEKVANGIGEPLLVFLDWGSAEARAVERGRAALARAPTASLQPIGVVNRRDGSFGAAWPFGYYAFVLVHGPAGNALYGADLPKDGRSELVLITDSQVPADVQLRGLVYLPDKMVEVDDQIKSEARFNRLCLFGDGLYCLSYDGSFWNRKVEIEAASGSPFNSVAVWNDGQEWFLVAVGDEGRIAKVSLDAQTKGQEVSVGTDSDLLTISAAGSRLAIAGENGAAVYIDGRTDEPTICNLFDQTIVSFKWWGSRLRGIERNGELFEVTFGGCQACAYDISVGSALYGRLFGLGGDFLLLNQESVLLVTANLEAIVLQ